jgi:hypothetical protein
MSLSVDYKRLRAMSNLRRRLACIEARMRTEEPSIPAVIIINDLDGLDIDEGQSWPSGRRYIREPPQTVEQFRTHARTEAQRLGERTIIFGVVSRLVSGL